MMQGGTLWGDISRIGGGIPKNKMNTKNTRDGKYSKLGYDSDQPILWDYGVVTRDPDRRKRKPSSLIPSERQDDSDQKAMR